MKTLGVEFFKWRRRYLPLMIVLFLSVEIAWAFMSATISISRNPESAGWDSVIMTLASMNGLFFPIMAAVVVSRICDMEHKGNTWKLLMTASVKRSWVYATKYIGACLLLLFAVLLQTFAIVGFGVLSGFLEPIPFVLLLKFLGGTMLTSMVVIALQQWVSLALKNQSFSLCLGMIGGFIGLTSELFPTTISRLFIWSYYARMSPVTYNYVDDSMAFVTREIGAGMPITVLLIGVGIYMVGNIHVSRKEV